MVIELPHRPSPTVLRLALALVLASSACVALAAYKYREADQVVFPGNDTPTRDISGDRLQMTLRLPPQSDVTANHGTVEMLVLWRDSSKPLPPSPHFSAAAQSPFGQTVQCTNVGADRIRCAPNVAWLAGLTQDTTVTLEVGGAAFGKAKPRLTVTYRPVVGGPFVASLTAPRVTKGSPATFRVRLNADAPAGGKEIFFYLQPAECFVQIVGGASYSQSDLNRIVVPAGARVQEFSVGSTQDCPAVSGRLLTWSEADQVGTSSPPVFMARDFPMRFLGQP